MPSNCNRKTLISTKTAKTPNAIYSNKKRGLKSVNRVSHGFSTTSKFAFTDKLRTRAVFWTKIKQLFFDRQKIYISSSQTSIASISGNDVYLEQN